jgi:hypothetical protein
MGFQDAMEARTCFYRRAKLLFDFNALSDNISNSQGALLLTYYSSDREGVSCECLRNKTMLTSWS